MRLGKVLYFLIIFLLPAVASAAFPIDWNWTSIGGGWSCLNRNRCTSGGFAGPCYSAESTSGTPDSSHALKITYPQGYTAGGEPAACFNSFDAAKNEIYGQFYFKWSSGYTWNGVVNKIIYIGLGPGATAAGDVIGVVSQKIQFRSQYAEVVNRNCNAGYNPTINTNQWYKITWHGVVNTPGSSNGVMQLWIDDKMAMNYSNVKWLKDGETDKGFYEVSIVPVYGGGTSSGAIKPKDEYLWISRTIVQDSPIIDGESAPIKIPMTPSKISIEK